MTKRGAGRPPVEDKNVRLTINIPPALLDELREASSKLELSMSAIAVKAIKTWLKTKTGGL
jgi:hypothetical protein